jgi:hypothetical protein
MKRWMKTAGSLMMALGLSLAGCGGDPVTEARGCAVDNGGCGADAVCSESGAAVACACKPGFTGDGLTCAAEAPRPGFGYRLGGAGNDYGKDVAVDAAGNVYVTGYIASAADFDFGPGVTELPGLVPADVFLAKYNPRGELQWARRMGSQGADMPHSVIVAPDGSLLLHGYFTGVVDFDPGEGTLNLQSRGARDIFIARFDGNGGLVRVVGFGGEGDDEGMDLEVDGSGNLYITALLTGTADVDPGAGVVEHTVEGTGDVLVAKYGADFSHQWSFRLGAAGEDQGAGIDVDASGRVFVSGSFQQTVDFDPGAGERLLTSAGGNDLFVARYGADGAHLWSHRMGGPGNDVMAPGGIDLDASGRVLVTGRFSGTVDFDPGAGTASLQSAGSEDCFVARYSPAGAYELGFRIGSTALDGGHRVVVDAAGDILVAGWFRNTVDFDTGAATASVTARGTGGAGDLFVAKYSAGGAYLWARTLGDEVTGADNWSIVAGLAADAERNVIITGRLFGSADADPGEGAHAVSSAGGSDVVLVKYTADGRLWRAP